MSKSLTTLSLFAGGGGLDLGFSTAGYTICLSTDKDSYSCKTLQINAEKKTFYPSHPVVIGDICQTPTHELLSKANCKASDIDLIIGGPPCQAFSIFGKRGGVEDPRGKLVWEYLRVVRDINPTAFVFENVDGLKTIHGGKFYQELLEALSLNGEYVVSPHSYEVADYGIPQFRRRIFFIGFKKGKNIPLMPPTHGTNFLVNRPYVTVKTVLDNFPGPTLTIPNHQGRIHSQVIIDRYSSLKYGERDHKTRINKLHPDKPSYTIVVGSDAGGGKGHIHPYSPREVTPRESARIQTFPDWWTFYGTGRHVIRQVGNTVPPLFAALLAEHIKYHIFDDTNRITYDELVDKLDLPFLQYSIL